MESYHLGKRQVSHRKLKLLALAIVLILVAIGGVMAKLYLRANTVIDPPPPPVTTQITGNNEATKHFDEGIFALDLPKDWVFSGHKTGQYSIYSWHNTKTNPGVEQLQIYMDTIPSDLGVNRVLPVQGESNRAVPTTVSDTCANFTGNKVPGSPTTPAKWDNIDFLCDLANYERDVVGTSSTDGINTVTLTGSTGKHKVFFAYTDNGGTPNFTIFTNAVQSFRLK
jgi:hypothetical protein